jgi:hypothetical protein
MEEASPPAAEMTWEAARFTTRLLFSASLRFHSFWKCSASSRVLKRRRSGFPFFFCWGGNKMRLLGVQNETQAGTTLWSSGQGQELLVFVAEPG